MGQRVLLTGGSGMIGGLVLASALADSAVEEVVCLVRRPLEWTHAKLSQVVVKDFLNLAAYEELNAPFDMIFHCQGVYTGAVDAATFEAVTVDYAVAIAERILPTSKEGCFCLFSAMGADRSGTAKAVFARTKGLAETKLAIMGFARLHCFRPAYIYPVTPRKEPNLMYQISRFLYPAIRLLGPKYTIRSDQLASAMYNVGRHGGKREIYENEQIRVRGQSI
jgi:uncharacterized protein YbjT (DUF2867 family)